MKIQMTLFALGGKVRFAVRGSPIRQGRGAGNAMTLEHRAQDQPREPKAGVGQKRSAIDSSTATANESSYLFHIAPLTNGYKIIVIQQRMNQIVARA